MMREVVVAPEYLAGERIKAKMTELVDLVQQTAREEPEMQEWLVKTGLLCARSAQWEAFAG
jgi:hypothetical protein